MSSAWELFGLNPRTSGLRDLRRAYAQLVKKNRPDRDPEGFRRVQDAYEEIKVKLKRRDRQRAVGRQPAEAEPATSAPAREERPRAAGTGSPAPASSDRKGKSNKSKEKFNAHQPSPHRWRAAGFEAPAAPPETPYGKLEARLEEVHRNRDRTKIFRILRELLTAWRASPEHADGWSNVLSGQMRDNPKPVLNVFRVEDCELDIRRGGEFTPSLVGLWAEHGMWERIRNVAAMLTERADGLPVDETALAMVACARALSLVDHRRARQLADRAFHNIDPGQREMMFHDVDLLLVIGREINRLKPRHRETLAQCVCSGEADPEDKRVLAAVLALNQLGQVDVTRRYIRDRFPEVRRKLRRRLDADAVMTTGGHGGSSAGEWLGNWWWVVLFGVIMGIRCGSTDSHLPEPPSKPPRIPQWQPPTLNDPAFEIMLEKLQKLEKFEIFPDRRKLFEDLPPIRPPIYVPPPPYTPPPTDVPPHQDTPPRTPEHTPPQPPTPGRP